MLHRSAFLATAVSIATTALAATTPISDSKCTCYLSNGTEPAFYKEHRFFDFRSLAHFASSSGPDVLSSAQDTSLAPPTSAFFTSPLWTSTWQAQSWNNSKAQTLNGDATVLMINSPNNIFIQANNNDSSYPSSTHLTMRTRRQRAFQSSAEFQSVSSAYHYLSLRMLARTTGSSGAVSAVFTYRDAKALTDIQEADMEIVTRGPRNRVQYTNQPSYTTDGRDDGIKLRATRNATLPWGKDWSDWAVYRLDWTPKQSTWYVDGQQVASIAFQVPRDPAGINVNHWSNGGSWSGNMSIGGESSLQIQWIEMLYNTTEKTTGGREGDATSSDKEDCRVVCSVDEAPETGAAAKLWGDEKSQAMVLAEGATSAVLVCLGACLALVLTM
ncbi:hypothetical protein E4U42_002566 [Claviceps africana]|uniref:GH16 domain-containing protein n=1 Tax=Claviceps africana TaxID=83212 RepID=A0A8K0J7S6_9HYPO|nr:hypothetical protein E4U42_002566 [Claviceps africana]